MEETKDNRLFNGEEKAPYRQHESLRLNDNDLHNIKVIAKLNIYYTYVDNEPGILFMNSGHVGNLY